MKRFCLICLLLIAGCADLPANPPLYKEGDMVEIKINQQVGMVTNVNTFLDGTYRYSVKISTLDGFEEHDFKDFELAKTDDIP